MISNNLIFSKAAALRILKVATKIEAVRIFKGAVQVTYLTKNGRCSTFLSKSQFFDDFLTFRQEGAKTVTVSQWGAGSYQNHYSCHSSKSERIYTVKLLAGLAMCECPDYEEQHRQLGNAKPGCKHVIATLNHIGYGSLTEYMDTMAQRAKADLYGGGWDEPASLKPVAVTPGKKTHSSDPFGGFNF